MVVVSKKQVERSKNTIQSLLDKPLSYSKVGKLLGVNQGVIYMFIHDGYIPQSDEIKRKLGLEEGSEIIISVRKRDPTSGRLLQND